MILDSVPAAVIPNDNFDHYRVEFAKSGGAFINITTSTTRVPNVLPVLPPPPGDEGVLAAWDIVSALDAGPLPSGSPPDTPAPYPKLYRGQRCAYLIRLYATDTTRIHDSSSTHAAEDYWPFCIVNDLT